MRHHDKAERRKNAVDEQTRPHIVRLIEEYYPALLRARILRCIQRQRYGQWTNLCRHAWCPACSPRESYTRAMRHLETFRQFTPPGEKVRVAHEVYTLPPMLHAAVNTTEGLARWKRAVIGTIRELHRAEAAGVLNLHSMGDLDITKRHPHWDVLINGYVLTPEGPAKLEAARFDYDEGRAAYIRHVCREFRLTPENAPQKIDVWWDRRQRGHGLVAFYTGQAKVKSKFLYSARNVYQPDKAWRIPEERAHGGLTWAYKPKEKEPARAFDPRKVMANLLAQQAWLRGRKRHVWFGYMADNQRRTSLPRFRGEAA